MTAGLLEEFSSHPVCLEQSQHVKEEEQREEAEKRKLEEKAKMVVKY